MRDLRIHQCQETVGNVKYPYAAVHCAPSVLRNLPIEGDSRMGRRLAAIFAADVVSYMLELADVSRQP